MKIVAVIPARQWSRGTPDKNRRHYRDTEEIALTHAETALLTTDDPVIISLSCVTIVHRPESLSDGPVERAVAHALEGIDADIVVVLQPSSPSKNRGLYVGCAIGMLKNIPLATSVVSVVPWVGEPPQKACTLEGGILRVPPPWRRQDCPPAYRRDGTVYAVRAEYAKRGDLYGPRPIPLRVSLEDSITID